MGGSSSSVLICGRSRSFHLPSIRSRVSAPRRLSRAHRSEMPVSTAGNTALSAMVKLPMFAWVSKTSRKEVTMAALAECRASPANKAIKPSVTVTAERRSSCP